MGKKLLGWVALAFVVFFILSNPAGAADTVHGVAGQLGEAAEGLGEFVTRLSGGDR